MTCGDTGSCHSSHTAINHMPVHDATNATSVGCTVSGCHETGAAHSVDSTSVVEQHSTATIGTSVSGKTNDGCNICHGGSGWADVAQTALDNLTHFECVGCHEGILLGSYDPADSGPLHGLRDHAHGVGTDRHRDLHVRDLPQDGNEARALQVHDRHVDAQLLREHLRGLPRGQGRRRSRGTTRATSATRPSTRR